MRIFNDKYSLVRVLHSLSESEDIDIYINDVPFYRDLSFAEFSPYIYVPKGEYEMIIYIAETKENPIVKQNVIINPNELVTISVVGTENGAQLLNIKEDTQPPDKNLSKVRVVHLSQNSPEINILADNNKIFENVKFKDVTEYKEIPAKVYKVDLEVVLNGKIIKSNLVKINEGKVYTFYAIGNVPNVEIVQSLDGVTFME